MTFEDVADKADVWSEASKKMLRWGVCWRGGRSGKQILPLLLH